MSTFVEGRVTRGRGERAHEIGLAVARSTNLSKRKAGKDQLSFPMAESVTEVR
jgi:hypothetical protein